MVDGPVAMADAVSGAGCYGSRYVCLGQPRGLGEVMAMGQERRECR